MTDLFGTYFDEADDDEQRTNGEESAEESVLEPEEPIA
jgi:hypothetical protein